MYIKYLKSISNNGLQASIKSSTLLSSSELTYKLRITHGKEKQASASNAITK